MLCWMYILYYVYWGVICVGCGDRLQLKNFTKVVEVMCIVFMFRMLWHCNSCLSTVDCVSMFEQSIARLSYEGGIPCIMEVAINLKLNLVYERSVVRDQRDLLLVRSANSTQLRLRIHVLVRWYVSHDHVETSCSDQMSNPFEVACVYFV